MIKKRWKNFAIALLFSVSTSAYAEINIHEGKWEITNTIEMKGGFNLKIPGTSITQCIDKTKIVPQTDKKINKYCTVSEQNVVGDTVTWKMRCSNNMQSEGSATYHGETFEGVVHAKTEIPNMGMMNITIHSKGKRIGECK